MLITTCYYTEGCTVRPMGEVDAQTAPAFERSLSQASDGIGKGVLALDMAEVEYISSAGLGALVVLIQHMQGGSQSLEIYNSLPNVLDTFNLLRLGDYLTLAAAGKPLPPFGKCQTWKLNAPTNLTYIRGVRHELQAQLESLGVPDDTRYHAALIVEELCANLIRHGFARNTESDFWLEAVTKPGQVTLRLLDSGPRFDPSAYNPLAPQTLKERGVKGGLGLAMVQRLSKSISYRHEKGQNQTEVVLTY